MHFSHVSDSNTLLVNFRWPTFAQVCTLYYEHVCGFGMLTQYNYKVVICMHRCFMFSLIHLTDVCRVHIHKFPHRAFGEYRVICFRYDCIVCNSCMAVHVRHQMAHALDMRTAAVLIDYNNTDVSVDFAVTNMDVFVCVAC